MNLKEKKLQIEQVKKQIFDALNESEFGGGNIRCRSESRFW